MNVLFRLKTIIIENKKMFIIIGSILLFCLLSCIGFFLIFNYTKPTIEENIAYNEPEEEIEVKSEENSSLLIDIKGEVVNPGVYQLKNNSRVIDAIKASGGLKNTASTKNINLSMLLKDQDVIIINSIEELKETKAHEKELNNNAIINPKPNNNNNSLPKDNKSLININTSSISELSSLPGIGESKAKAIIAYREKNGLFKSIEQIKEVKGIADKLYDKIKTLIIT
ncbi:MAG: helix-hairpin-helix domain-containing protein [Bacilli bacterium]